MNICEIKDRQLWDSFVTSQKDHTFLQSFAWGEFNEAMAPRQARGKGTVWRIGIYDTDKLVAVVLVMKVHAKRGNFLFVPHGPVLAKGEQFSSLRGVSRRETIFKKFVETLKELAKQEKVSFIRISPLLGDTEENRKFFKDLGFRSAPIHMHAEITWTLDLSLSEEELLANMRKTTRNLIRRAIKEDVEVKTGNSDQEVERFHGLYQETVKKHRFAPFSLTYLKNQVRILPNTTVFTAYHHGQPLASAVIVFYGSSAFYHHGASIPSKIPAAYLLQWEAIRAAKRKGHRFYNFWGIIKEDAPLKHPWQGITLFKKGFGGFAMDYMHAQDLPISWRYWINWGIEYVRRRRRNL